MDGLSHAELERLVKTGDFDFVQFNYSLDEPEAEARLRRGDPVTVQLQSPAFAIRTTGKAMANGAEGDRIGVENATTRRVVQGTVTGEGKVTVEF